MCRASTSFGARLTEGVHPECLAVPGVLGRQIVGNKDARGRGIHFNAFLSNDLEHMDMLSAGLDACVKVKVSRA